MFEVNYRQLEDFAATHDLSAEEIAKWVQADPNFAERFLETHGKVAYGTYLKIKEYTEFPPSKAPFTPTATPPPLRRCATRCASSTGWTPPTPAPLPWAPA